MRSAWQVTTNNTIVPSSIALDATCASARPFRRRWFGQGLLIVILSVCSYLIISHFIVQSVRVVGLSMTPTLADSHMCLLNRWVLYFRAPRASELVVIRDPTDSGLAVKRIVGVPGDRILVKNGSLFLNGSRLQEPYLPSGTPTFAKPRVQEQAFTCAAGQYFVLGDNRNLSLDSRSYGPISRQNILGLVIP